MANLATVGCRRCAEDVKIGTAARTGGFCESCARKQEQEQRQTERVYLVPGSRVRRVSA